MRPALTLTLAILLAAPARADDTLRVTAWNVQLLPWIARAANNRRQADLRAVRAGERVATRDVVGLNEVFDLAGRYKLTRALRAKWGERAHLLVHRRPKGKIVNGGLLLASRFPIVASHHYHFTVASQFRDHGFRADGFAAKGVLHGRLDLGATATPRLVDVFVTHLEARDAAIRGRQQAELAAFVKTHTTRGRPALVLGDLNTRAEVDADGPKAGTSYARLMGLLRTAHPARPIADIWLGAHPKGRRHEGTSRPLADDGGKRIDYVFASLPKTIRVQAMRVDRARDRDVGSLSDHSAVEADLRWPGLDTGR